MRRGLTAMIRRMGAVRHVRTHAERDDDGSRSRKASRKCPGYLRGGLQPEAAGQGAKLATSFQASTILTSEAQRACLRISRGFPIVSSSNQFLPLDGFSHSMPVALRRKRAFGSGFPSRTYLWLDHKPRGPWSAVAGISQPWWGYVNWLWRRMG